MAKKVILRCSFCGKSQHDVYRLVTGNKVAICDGCVSTCVDMCGVVLPVDCLLKDGVGISAGAVALQELMFAIAAGSTLATLGFTNEPAGGIKIERIVRALEAQSVERTAMIAELRGTIAGQQAVLDMIVAQSQAAETHAVSSQAHTVIPLVKKD